MANAQVRADGLAGTWECFGPGQTHPKKPPIVFFGESRSDDKGAASMEIDGFSRAVAGPANVSADADGWLKISPASGSPLFVKGFDDRSRKVDMQLRREGVGSYRCYRLPKYDNLMIPRDRVVEQVK